MTISILKYYYTDRSIYWGYEVDQLQQENLKLFVIRTLILTTNVTQLLRINARLMK